MSTYACKVPSYYNFVCLYTVIMEDTELMSRNISLTFLDGSTNQTQCVSIPITNDTFLEGDHNFTIDIISAGSPPHAEIGAQSNAAVTIQDDESELMACLCSQE